MARWRFPWARKGVDSSLELFREIYGGQLAKSGVNVTWDTAIKVSTVFACARVIANGIAQVPLKLFQESDNGARLPAREHPLYDVLHRKPNPWQTSFEYRETLGLHLMLAGRHYSFINRLRGKIVELIPFEPGQVESKRLDDGAVVYRVTLANGKSKDYPAESIWHVRGPSWNGWEGLDAVRIAREAIGLAMAAEEQHARMFANGVSTTGVYSVEGTLSKQQYKDLRDFIIENNSGVNSGLPMIVDRGAKWLATAMSGVDSQHLETRRFQVEQVCSSLGVLPIMIGHADKTITYASAEQMFIAHVVHSLAPHHVRIEQSIGTQLLTDADAAKGIYAKFVTSGLLRGSSKERAEYFAKALGAGGSPPWMTQDEVRGLEELNPMGGEAARLAKPTNVGGTPADDDDEGTAK